MRNRCTFLHSGFSVSYFIDARVKRPEPT